ncbi:MAG: molybdopterin cofactor-binding domain-containing protein [Aliidongia sp.]
MTGGASYVQDLRLPGMLHARVVRPPSYGARLDRLDSAAIEAMPGVVKVLRDGDFLAVVAAREWQAVTAMQALAAAARWTETATLPAETNMAAVLKQLPSEDYVILDRSQPVPPGAKTLSAQYSRPYLEHGSIGPSCAVARFEDGALTIWSHTQGVYPLRGAVAELVGLPPDKIRCIHTEGSGCYGHNGADDVAGDAALLAMALPGQPVRVQLMRDQEHLWDPSGRPWCPRRRRRSMPADGSSIGPTPSGAIPMTAGRAGPACCSPDNSARINSSRSRSSRSRCPKAAVIAMPFRSTPCPVPESCITSCRPCRCASRHNGRSALISTSLRSNPSWTSGAGGTGRSGRVSPAASGRSAGQGGRRDRRREIRLGRLAAHARPRSRLRLRPLQESRAYAAVALDLAVDRETGAVRLGRVVAAVDSGQPVSPDGIRNQIEGAIVQSASWTLYETVSFDRTRIISRDWSSYPILRFPAAPRSVEVHVVDRPGQPFLGNRRGRAGTDRRRDRQRRRRCGRRADSQSAPHAGSAESSDRHLRQVAGAVNPSPALREKVASDSEPEG